MSFSNRHLQIKAKTWNRDSYGLYDYESANYRPQSLDITQPGKLVRSNNELAWTESPTERRSDLEKNPKNKTQETLAIVSENSEGIRIAPYTSVNSEARKVWCTVGREGYTNHALKENDLIKLGRALFRVRQIRNCDNDAPQRPPEELVANSFKEFMISKNCTTSKANHEIDSDEDNSASTCKICLAGVEDESDPLISPCRCIGSVRFVHLKCVQNWIISKLDIEKSSKVLTIYWKNLSCELCKTSLPMNFNHEGRQLQLLPLENKINESHIILESFSKEKELAGIHIISLAGKENIKIGRGHDCDLKLADISVSRVHANININQDGKLFLQDNNSKFGTLVLLRESFVLNDQNPKSPWLQCGRTIFKLNIRKPWVIALPCLGTLVAITKLCQPKYETSPTEKNQLPDETRERLQTNYEDIQLETSRNHD